MWLPMTGKDFFLLFLMIYNMFDLLLMWVSLVESVAVFLIKEIIHYKKVAFCWLFAQVQ